MHDHPIDEARLPCLQKKLIYGLIVLSTAVALTLHVTRANDLFWQIRCGHDILAQHRVPRVDTYSWTSRGRTWCVNEWLSFVLFAKVFDATGGFAGPFVLMLALIALLAATLFAILYEETKSAAAACALSIVALNAIEQYLQLRPYLFSFWYCAITAALVVRVIDKRIAPAWLFALLPMFALWSNLHQGVIVGVAMVGLAGLGALLNASGRLRSIADLVSWSTGLIVTAATLLCFIATLMTPYGAGLYQLVWKTVHDPSISSCIVEWKPLKLTMSYWSGCFVLLCLLFACAVASDWRRRSFDIGKTSFFVVSLTAAALHRRNVPFVILPCTVYFAGEITALLKHAWSSVAMRLPLNASVRSKIYSIAPTTAIVAYAAFWLATAGLIMNRIERVEGSRLAVVANTYFGINHFPVDACSFMDQNKFPSGMRLFNDFDDGGMLILYRPQDPVFIDGRADLFVGPLLDQYFSLVQRSQSYDDPSLADKNFLDQYDFDCAVVQMPLAAYYFSTRPDYALVFVHVPGPILIKGVENCWIFVRKRPEYAPLISRSRMYWASLHDGIFPIAAP